MHGLWERAPDSRVRDQVVLFNFATTASVAIRIVSLYVALFALILGGAELVVTHKRAGFRRTPEAGTSAAQQPGRGYRETKKDMR